MIKPIQTPAAHRLSTPFDWVREIFLTTYIEDGKKIAQKTIRNNNESQNEEEKLTSLNLVPAKYDIGPPIAPKTAAKNKLFFNQIKL
ncbi:hypothetical protein NBRC116493_21120 [Aurantivibrio infirmus]